LPSTISRVREYVSKLGAGAGASAVEVSFFAESEVSVVVVLVVLAAVALPFVAFVAPPIIWLEVVVARLAAASAANLASYLRPLLGGEGRGGGARVEYKFCRGLTRSA
jgi:hypothetical protein